MTDLVIGAFKREWRRSPARMLTRCAACLLIGSAVGVLLTLWAQR